MSFLDRRQAGERLAQQLSRYANNDGLAPDGSAIIVMGLPRGGVPVAYEVARSLNAPLDVLVARKLGAPHNPELGIGAIAMGESVVLNDRLIDLLKVPRDYINQIIRMEGIELERRSAIYRGDMNMPNLRGKTVIIVDDGLATGITAMAAIMGVRKQKPKRLILAVPVCSEDAADALRSKVDELVCVDKPAQFRAVGEFYQQFDQTSDEEVIDCLIRNLEEVPDNTLRENQR